MLRTGKVIVTSLAGIDNKIFESGETVNEKQFLKNEWGKLIKEKFIEELPEGEWQEERQSEDSKPTETVNKSLRTGKVLVSDLGALGNRIFHAGDSVNEKQFPPNNWDALVGGGFVEEDPATPYAEEEQESAETAGVVEEETAETKETPAAEENEDSNPNKRRRRR